MTAWGRREAISVDGAPRDAWRGSSQAPPDRGSTVTERAAARRVAVVIATHGLVRVAGGASSVLVGVYLADLAARGGRVGAGLAGTLAAISFGAELIAAVPLGMLSDAVSVRVLMTGGALVAALATFLFGVTHDTTVFLTSRALEGLAAAAVIPALLAYLTDATADNDVLRARAMSYFELSLLAGLALGGIVGAQLWSAFGTGAFAGLAVLYVLAALLLYIGSGGQSISWTRRRVAGPDTLACHTSAATPRADLALHECDRRALARPHAVLPAHESLGRFTDAGRAPRG